MSTVLAAMFPGHDPVWLMVVSPPGGGKTEIVRTLTGPYIYSVDTLTNKSLVSGLKEKGGKQRSGILGDLDGKVLVIKDLTIMLENQRYGEESVFGQLRAAYDGEYAAVHGSGMKRQAFRSTFGLIAAVTPVIDQYRNIHTSLGERFLTTRIFHSDRLKVITKSRQNTDHKEEQRGELATVVKHAISFYKELGELQGIPEIEEYDLQKIDYLSELIALCRCPVKRDHQHKVVSDPEPEYGTRIANQLTRLSQMMKLFEGYEFSKIARVARDSVNQPRIRVLRVLYNEYEPGKRVSPWEIFKKSGTAYNTTKEIMEDLSLIGVCDTVTKGKATEYSLKDTVMLMMVETDFLGVNGEL
jgi:hypothetical protein